MPLCVHSLRFAVRSSAATSAARLFPPLQWHASCVLFRRDYTTSLIERQQFEKPESIAEDRQYVDFVLDGYGKRTNEGDSVQSQRFMGKRRTPSVSKAGAQGNATVVSKATRRTRTRPIQPRINLDDRARIAARVAAARRNRGLRPAVQALRIATRTSAVFSSAWNTKFFRIARRYDTALPEYYMKEAPALTFSPQVMEWVDSLMTQMKQQSGPLDIESFARQRGMIGREVWSEVALWLLCYDKATLFNFLEATHTALYPPINWVEGCLSCLARHYLLNEEQDSHSRAQLLVQLFMKLVNRTTEEQFHIHSSFFRLVLPYCTDGQVGELYGLIKLHRVNVSQSTLLHFADYFARHARVEQSLDALLEAKIAGADIHGVGFKSVCSTLLRRCLQHPGGLRLCLRMIENLVSAGLKLNRTLCNIVMLNAVESRDLDTADAVHRSAIEQGFVPNSYTCAIRLKACKVDVSNAERLKETIEEAIASGAVRRNHIVAGEVIHCLALHHAQAAQAVPETRWTPIFAPVAAAYLQLFDPAPLQRIGIELPALQDAPAVTEQRLTPSPHVIATMVQAYLRSRQTVEDTETMYSRWRELVEAGDEPLAACAAMPHLSNIFLKHMTTSHSTLLQAARVIRDMQKPLPATAGVKQAKPDVYTWSIFQHGFAAKGETKLAEQVMQYMRTHDIEPNVVTWSSLMSGYAVAQDSEGVLDTMRRMEQSGTAWNDWTQRGLRHFRNKQKLQELLAHQKLEQSLDFSGELKNGLVQKLSEYGELTDKSGSSADSESLSNSEGQGSMR